MPVLQVTVKWSGKKFDAIELDTDQPGLVFKTQLFSLTGVAPDRQKIMIKGGIVKDDTDFNKLGLKDGHSFMMMGTVGELPKVPTTATVFLEDMSDNQIAQALKIPAGLVNLGNTCYMNATIQCLRAIPELSTALSALPAGSDGNTRLAASLRDLLKNLSISSDSITPLVFLQVLRLAYPQFSQADNRGFMQQDAQECWSQLVSSLKGAVPGLCLDGTANPDAKFVSQFLTGEMYSSIKCDESDEPAQEGIESFTDLTVNIGSGVSTYMMTDILNGLTEKIEKHSQALGRSAVHTKSRKISRLPAYLAINFVRFQWKAQERIKAKILKKVKFPFELDISPCCTAELQEKLSPAKAHLKAVSDKKADAKKKRKAGSETEASQKMDIDAAPQSDQVALMKDIGVDSSLIDDVGCNSSGVYDLVAVLTHVGRAADSGHYIGWVKQDNSDEWWKFDDDKVSMVKQDDITKLEGGGDFHTAYICLYTRKKLESLDQIN
ncbi:uncharacterized protein BJ171DRAFT_576853 [Polychytrium aggregatum]|uniref:uncharacterized protein n=1 Tax=Polychytrium aggregatum TaxID=110093 RepID=UPI0022FEA047|nr:uncharacterized protein BJ171DRAFT_576853 [Polychytrium aggregatum]KAI9209280.1 hypothetical protein BJ171DRAFT_576853 [Polychytrium aggregatum]